MPALDASSTRFDTVRSLTGLWNGFASWWWEQFRQAIPPQWLDRIGGTNKPCLTIWRDGESVICRMVAASGPIEVRLPLRGFGRPAIDRLLAQHELSRDAIRIGLGTESRMFLVRDVAVPQVAIDALPQILDREILHRTPFQPDDIWHGSVPSASDAQILSLRQWIVRRDRVDVALAEVGLCRDDIDYLAVENGQEALEVITFAAKDAAEPSRPARRTWLPVAAAIASLMLGFLVVEWRQSSIAAEVEVELAEAREAMQGKRGNSSQLFRLAGMKAEGGVLDIWDELSRILPDHTFLTELRIMDGNVTMSGFSPDAARLVRIVDQSPRFAGATLVGAITADANEQKDRFNIGFRLRSIRQPQSGSPSRARS